MPQPEPDNEVVALRQRIAELEGCLEREAAERAALANSETGILQNFPYAVLISRDGKIVFANEVAARLHGLDAPAGLIGRESIELVHPEDRHLILARREQRALDQSVPHRRLRLDGSEFIARLRPAEIVWGGTRAIMLVIRDTTERANNLLALETSERRYRELIEGSSFGIQISRKNGERLFVNSKIVEMFRYDSAEDMLRVTEAGALVAPHDREWMVQRRLARARGEPVPETYEYDALRKDGTVMPVQVFFRKVYWEGQDAIQRTMIDITPRREAEKAQRESEERYRHLAELSPDGILVNTDGVIVFANESLAKILGEVSPEALVGTTALDWIPPENRKESIARRQKAMEGKAVDRREGVFQRRDGTLTHVDRAVKPITWQGKPSTLVLVRDVNERKRAEAAMLAQQALLETVINAMDPTLCAWDKDLRLIAWNRKWAEERKFPEGLPTPGMTYEEVMRWSFAAGRYDAVDMEKAIARRMAELRREIEPETVLVQPDGRTLLRKRHPLPCGG